MNVLEKIKSKRTHLNIKERADMSSAMLDQPVTLQIEQGSASGNCHKEAQELASEDTLACFRSHQQRKQIELKMRNQSHEDLEYVYSFSVKRGYPEGDVSVFEGEISKYNEDASNRQLMTLSCDSSVIINPEGVSLIRLSKFCRLSEGVGIFIAKFVVKLIHKAQAKR